jgi:EAL domain-containing protein (putative c-di-GMP-specific phosphodiesterase class I)
VLTLCSSDSTIPETLADRLIEELSRPIQFEGRPCRLGASVGIARTPMIEAEELLTCSDIALYKAKTGGRAMKAVFDHVDLDRLKVKKQLADDMLRGLEEDEFLPLYQPQIDLGSGEIEAIEALACWRHPERGLLSASEFAGVAQETQIDGRIDAAVFRKALNDWHEDFASLDAGPRLSFDMCLARLLDAALLDDLQKLENPKRISFELVETTFLEEDNAVVLERLNALRAMGVSLEVDDFGSGRASIVGLRRIAPRRLKIDRRLIDPIVTSDSARRLVGSIIEIGRALDIGVTAVGVSSKAHAQVLQTLGCQRGQGAFYMSPAPMSDLIAWARRKGKSMVA